VRNVSQSQTVFADSVSATPGQQVEFRLVVEANGNTTAQNVNLTDTLPTGFTLASGSVHSHWDSLTAGNSQTVYLTAQIADNSNFSCGTTTRTNTASVTTDNAGSASDTAQVNISRTASCGGGGGGSSHHLSLTKEVRNLTQGGNYSSSTQANLNDRVQFRLTVENTSSSTARDVRLTDDLPAGLSYISGTFTVDSGSSSGNLFSNYQSLGNLAGHDTRTITFQARATATGTLTNEAEVRSDNAGSDQDEASVHVSRVSGSNIDLILSKRAYNQSQNVDATTTTAQLNDTIVYTLTVENQGNADATGYVFTDDLSDVLQFSQLMDFGGSEFNLANLTVTWPSVTIPAHSSVEKTFSVKVSKTAQINQDNLMTNTFGNTVNVRVPSVGGIYVAPPTGNTTTLSLILGGLALAGFVLYQRKTQVLALIRGLTNS
jgi:uncharacterized repeat protein (TIGR01451 family)